MNEALQLLQGAQRVLVACHRRPDADALGSALGFATLMRALGKDVTVFVPDELPTNLHFLACAQVQRTLAADERFDVCFCMDTAAKSLLPDGLPSAETRGPLVIVDHHAAHDDVGDVVVRDTNACATAEVVMDMAEKLELRPVPPSAATPLYAALVADTGGFRYATTRSKVLRMAAELIDGGAEPWPVAYELFEGWAPERLKLLGSVLETLELRDEGRSAFLQVTRKMLETHGATDEMVEGMVNYGRMLRGTEAAVLLWEFYEDDALVTKLSFRSRGCLDVGKVAAQLGGGGHAAAAGATLDLPIEEASERVAEVVTAALQTCS